MGVHSVKDLIQESLWHYFKEMDLKIQSAFTLQELGSWSIIFIFKLLMMLEKSNFAKMEIFL